MSSNSEEDDDETGRTVVAAGEASNQRPRLERPGTATIAPKVVEKEKEEGEVKHESTDAKRKEVEGPKKKKKSAEEDRDVSKAVVPKADGADKKTQKPPPAPSGSSKAKSNAASSSSDEGVVVVPAEKGGVKRPGELPYPNMGSMGQCSSYSINCNLRCHPARDEGVRGGRPRRGHSALGGSCRRQW